MSRDSTLFSSAGMPPFEYLVHSIAPSILARAAAAPAGATSAATWAAQPAGLVDYQCHPEYGCVFHWVVDRPGDRVPLRDEREVRCVTDEDGAYRLFAARWDETEEDWEELSDLEIQPMPNGAALAERDPEGFGRRVSARWERLVDAIVDFLRDGTPIDATDLADAPETPVDPDPTTDRPGHPSQPDCAARLPVVDVPPDPPDDPARRAQRYQLIGCLVALVEALNAADGERICAVDFLGDRNASVRRFRPLSCPPNEVTREVRVFALNSDPGPSLSFFELVAGDRRVVGHATLTWTADGAWSDRVYAAVEAYLLRGEMPPGAADQARG
jgi:hypothetical protein